MSQYLRLGVAAEYFGPGQALIGTVREVLESRAPGMVDPSETFITGEGEGLCILVIPHHWLGGVSLVVLGGPEFVELRWAIVTDLIDHDQIDLGHRVDHWPTAGFSHARLGAVLAEEFSRQILWSCLYRGAATTPKQIRAFLDLRGGLKTLDVASEFSLWPWPRREVIERTSLASTNPPAYRLPVPIDQLLKQA